MSGIDHNISAERIYNNVVYDLDKLLCSTNRNVVKR